MANLLKIAQYFKLFHIFILILLGIFTLNSVAVSAKNACVKSSFVRVDDFYNRNVDKTNAAATIVRNIMNGDITLYHKKKQSVEQVAGYYHRKGNNAAKLLDDHLSEIKKLQESLQHGQRKINKAKSMSVEVQELSELLRISCLNHDQPENSFLANEIRDDGIRLLAKQNKIYAALLEAEAIFDKELAYTKKINKKLLQLQRKDEQIVELRNHQQQVKQFESKINFTDMNIHQHLQKLNNSKGIDGLVFIYSFDKDISIFTTEVAALADEHDKSFPAHLDALVKYAQKNGNEEINKENIAAKYSASLAHLQEHIRWYNSAKIVTQMAEQQALAYNVLGVADKGNLVELYKSAENIFFRFASNSQAANSHEMWKVAEIIGVKRFSSETGIDLKKNSPERKKQRYREQFKDIDVEPLIFGGPPEGVEYPHSYPYFKAEITYGSVNSSDDIARIQTSENIINRNRLALNALASDRFRSEIKQALNDYKQTMETFQELAGRRFKIENWQDLPVAKESWLSLAQIWSITEYQLMFSRFQAMQQMLDAKADHDWAASNEKLGFK